jgi:predicted TIM-barrel fold metal-dependent hydrolase
MKTSTFREGVALLERLGLVYDVFCFHPQLDDFADLARALPDQTMVLNHIGAPLAVGPYAERRTEVMADWKAKMTKLAALPNVLVKIGGLGMGMFGLPSAGLKPRSHSSVLAEEWRPYVQTCIDLFGTDRCMFESNYPPDRETASYGALWNTFKRLSEGFSADERTALFSGTANRTYNLGISV